MGAHNKNGENHHHYHILLNIYSFLPQLFNNHDGFITIPAL